MVNLLIVSLACSSFYVTPTAREKEYYLPEAHCWDLSIAIFRAEFTKVVQG
jgi:hypothetical protein